MASRSSTAAEGELARARRILQHELRGGCRDRIVIGGLSGYAHQLQTRLHTAEPHVLTAATRLAQLLSDYAHLAPPSREERLRSACQELDRALGNPPHSPLAEREGAKGDWVLAPPSSPRRTEHSAALALSGRSSVLSLVARRDPPGGVSLDTPIEELKGIGPKRARLYQKLGLGVVRDLLFHVPARHLAYPPAMPIADLFFQPEGSVEGLLEKVEVEDLLRGLKKLRATIRDASGTVTAVWLRHGFAHLGIRPGERIAISGKLSQAGRHLTFDNPDFERADAPPVHTRGLVPVYPLTSGLYDKELRTRIHWALSHFAHLAEDPLPPTVQAAERLLPLEQALRTLHFPASREAHEQARRRFAFQELLTIQTVVLQRRRAWQEGGAPALPAHRPALEAVTSGLPFRLTDAQERVLGEILSDMAQPRPMTRLLQGEVGSGKTAVAALALVNAVAHGFQGALMAPTEILAEQHFSTLTRLVEASHGPLQQLLGRRLVVKLLTGSVKRKERQAIYDGARDGTVDILVGTQALIQELLEFARLGLVVVDEQHRFGVHQRVNLRRKTHDARGTPHLLVMTATPIPRTLALSLYGDLDLSVLDQMPVGRQPSKTVLLGPEERPLAYEKIRRSVQAGRQAFIICPLVEESEALEAKAATEEFERLRTGELKDLRLALLHGRMKSAQKDAVMRAFRDREFDVLVSTAVVEVGVDVPNATVMLIEGAERFGLAQLHQFRGRVGRGEHASVCVLLSELPDPQANERLRVVERSSNGLELAEHDLRLRGPGEYFGVRQSGFPDLKLARLDDAILVESARAAAARLLDADPTLDHPEHAPLKRHIADFMGRIGEPS